MVGGASHPRRDSRSHRQRGHEMNLKPTWSGIGAALTLAAMFAAITRWVGWGTRTEIVGAFMFCGTIFAIVLWSMWRKNRRSEHDKAIENLDNLWSEVRSLRFRLSALEISKTTNEGETK